MLLGVSDLVSYSGVGSKSPDGLAGTLTLGRGGRPSINRYAVTQEELILGLDATYRAERAEANRHPSSVVAENAVEGAAEQTAEGGGAVDRRGLPTGALDAIRSAGLTDPDASCVWTLRGADELAVRLARLLTHPELAATSDKGRLPLPHRAEADALRRLGRAAEARRGATPSGDKVRSGGLGSGLGASLGGGGGVGAGSETSLALLADFAQEKRKVLRSASEALQARAENPVAFAAAEAQPAKAADEGGGGPFSGLLTPFLVDGKK